MVNTIQKAVSLEEAELGHKRAELDALQGELAQRELEAATAAASDLAPRQPTNLLRRGIDMADQLMDRLEALARAEESSPILMLRGTFYEHARVRPSEFGVPNKAIPVDEHHVLIASDSCIGLCEWRTGTLKWRIYCLNSVVKLSQKHTYLLTIRRAGEELYYDGASAEFVCWDLRTGSIRLELAGYPISDSSPDETRILVQTSIDSILWQGKYETSIYHVRLLNITENPARVEHEGTGWGNPVQCKWKARLRHDKDSRRAWQESLDQVWENICSLHNSGDWDDTLDDGWDNYLSSYTPDWWEREYAPEQPYSWDANFLPDWRITEKPAPPPGSFADSISFDWDAMTAECTKIVGKYYEQFGACYSPDGKYIAVTVSRTDEESLTALVSLRYDPAYEVGQVGWNDKVDLVNGMYRLGQLDCFGIEEVPPMALRQRCLALVRSSDLSTVSEIELPFNVWHHAFSQDGRSVVAMGSDGAVICAIDAQGSLAISHMVKFANDEPHLNFCYSLYFDTDLKTCISVWRHYEKRANYLVGSDLTTGASICLHELNYSVRGDTQPKIGLIVCNDRVLFTDVSGTDVMLKDYPSGNVLFVIPASQID